MITPRTLRTPRSSKSSGKQETNIVQLFKFDFRDEKPEIIKIPRKNPKDPESIQPFLDLASKRMDLARAAKALYDENNNLITKYSEINPGMNLYVSCVKVQPEEDENTPLYKSRLPKNYGVAHKDLPTVRQPEYKPKPENSKQHASVAASQRTVKENLRDSMLALYNSLSPAHKEQLPYSQALQKLTISTQQYMVEDSLLSQFIGPTSVVSDTPLGQQTVEWAMSNLKGLSPEDCRFAITGPTQSGKSTILNIFVSLMFQKLQIANEAQNYIIFPLNWQIQKIYIEDIPKIYELIVSTTLNALKTASMKYIPLLDILNQWFLSVLDMPVLPTLPPSIQRFPNFPTTLVQQLAARIHKAWNSSNGFEEFMSLIFAFPDNIAKVFGFKSAIYVFDHFDECCLALLPPSRFSSKKKVSIPEILGGILDTTPFFVASLNDDLFFRYFTTDCVQLSTEHLIEQKENVQLILNDPSFTLTMDLCNGCPAYCAMFANIVKLAQKVQNKQAVKGQFAKFRSVVDVSRQQLLKQEFSRLCLLIKENNDDAIDSEIMSMISEKDELDITLH